MPPSVPPPLDQATLRRLWMGLPAGRCDRSFWTGFESLFSTFLDDKTPLHSSEFFSVPHTGRIQQEDLHYIDEAVVEQCNEQRMLYDAYTLLNPLAIAALLKVPIAVVVDQLLLGVEYQILTMHFVISCRSCAFDLRHYTNVNDVPFQGTYHTANTIRCPMCSDRTTVSTLNSVSVFFELQRLHPNFKRAHSRSFTTEQASKQLLESFFCPTGAGFATQLSLPRGKYLLCAPFAAAVVEIDVPVSAAAFDERDPFLPLIVDLKKYVVEPPRRAAAAQPRARSIGRATAGSGDGYALIAGTAGNGRRPVGNGGRGSVFSPSTRRAQSYARASRVGGGGSIFGSPSSRRQSNVTHGGGTDEDGDAGDRLVDEEAEKILPTQTLEVKHGKVQLRMYNTTASSGFVDLYVRFDRRAEFAAVAYPKQMSLPELLHCLPRGLRSRHLPTLTPLPPSETPTRGVFVRHVFDFGARLFVDSEVLAVLREVHRYSLEDQDGLLISVNSGGTSFECSFLSVTAALASSICFFQRVLVRLSEEVALCLRTSITEGPLLLAAYQGQYNDADNTRSAYPDIQFVGPAVYASDHPPIVPPTLYAREEERPTLQMARPGVNNMAGMGEFRTALREEAFDLSTSAAAAAVQRLGAAAAPKSFMPWLDEGDDGWGVSTGATSLLHGGSSAGGLGGVGSGVAASAAATRRRSDTLLGESASGQHRNSLGFPSGLTRAAGTRTMARFELRSVRRSDPLGHATVADIQAGSVPLNRHYAVKAADRPSSPHTSNGGGASGSPPDYALQSGVSQKGENSVEHDDAVLPYFLNYLVEHLQGATVVEERHALVVMVPTAVMHASVQLSNMLDRTSYTKDCLGPF